MGGDSRDDCVAFTGACVALILPGQVRQICSLGSSRLFDIFWRVRVLACHAGSLILWHFFPCSLYWFLNSYALALMQCCLSLKPQFNHGEHSEHSEHGGNLGFRAFPVVTQRVIAEFRTSPCISLCSPWSTAFSSSLSGKPGRFPFVRVLS